MMMKMPVPVLILLLSPLLLSCAVVAIANESSLFGVPCCSIAEAVVSVIFRYCHTPEIVGDVDMSSVGAAASRVTLVE